MRRPALRPAPTGLSMTGDVRQVALQWHIQCEDHALSDLIGRAGPEVEGLLDRLNVDQLSLPAWSLRDGECGEQFLEALVDVVPRRRAAS